MCSDLKHFLWIINSSSKMSEREDTDQEPVVEEENISSKQSSNDSTPDIPECSQRPSLMKPAVTAALPEASSSSHKETNPFRGAPFSPRVDEQTAAMVTGGGANREDRDSTSEQGDIVDKEPRTNCG